MKVPAAPNQLGGQGGNPHTLVLGEMAGDDNVIKFSCRMADDCSTQAALRQIRWHRCAACALALPWRCCCWRALPLLRIPKDCGPYPSPTNKYVFVTACLILVISIEYLDCLFVHNQGHPQQWPHVQTNNQDIFHPHGHAIHAPFTLTIADAGNAAGIGAVWMHGGAAGPAAASPAAESPAAGIPDNLQHV